jgi:endonuclease/exonuclease/phosphatase family metal-dependent hydrolase
MPVLLFAAAIPFPFKTFKMICVYIAIVAIAIGLRDHAMELDETLLSQSLIILAFVRAAAWSRNILFWSVSHAAGLTVPTVCLHLLLDRLALDHKDTSLHRDAPISPKRDTAHNTGRNGSQISTTFRTGRVGVTRVVVFARAVYVTSIVHYAAYISPGLALFVRGADKHMQPSLSTTVLPLLPWFASECLASCFGEQILNLAQTRAWESRDAAVASVFFFVLNVVGAVLVFIMRLGTASIVGASLLLTCMPWWIRTAVGRAKKWDEWKCTSKSGVVITHWKLLHPALAVGFLLHVILMFLFWQSCIPVRGLQGIFLLLVIFLVDNGEGLLQGSTNTVPSDESQVSTSPKPSRIVVAPRISASIFVTLAIPLLAIATVAAPTAPVKKPTSASVVRALQPGTTISVWSWNVQRGFDIKGGLNMDDVADLTIKEGVDLLALQESEALSPLTGGRDVPGYIAASTGEHEIAYGVDPLFASFDGTSILSSLPIVRQDAWPLYRWGVFPAFTMTEVDVALGSTDGGVSIETLTLINIHPTLVPIDMKEAAIHSLVERIDAAIARGGGVGTARVIVAGDFNIEPEESILDGLYARGLRHSFNPNRFSDFEDYPITREASQSRIDHIFFTPDTLTLAEESEVIVASEGISDHLAIKAIFAV